MEVPARQRLGRISWPPKASVGSFATQSARRDRQRWMASRVADTSHGSDDHLHAAPV